MKRFYLIFLIFYLNSMESDPKISISPKALRYLRLAYAAKLKLVCDKLMKTESIPEYKFPDYVYENANC